MDFSLVLRAVKDIFHFSFSLPQPFDDAGLGDLAVQQRRYRHSQEDEERINHRHGLHNKLIGEEPNSTGNSLYDYHRKQHTENS